MTQRVGIAGLGRVGGALALALRGRGDYVVSAVAGRTREAATHALAALIAPLSAGTAMRVCLLEEIAAHADLLLLCVPDDQLEAVVRALALADVPQGVRVAHVSGAHGLAVLRPLKLAGARVAALHPAQTFPSAAAGAAVLPGAAWAVTAGDADQGWAHALIQALDGVPVAVADAARTLYHAALVVGANGVSSVVSQARELLQAANVEQPDAFLEPLVTAAARNAARHGAAALTGPVRRGDAGTVRRQLDELRVVLPQAADAYLALARLALSQAVRAGLSPERAAELRAVLEEA